MVNTHLTFPHNEFDVLNRETQINILCSYVNNYIAEKKIQSISVILCGDLNGDQSDPVCSHLKRNGFASSFGVCNSTEAGMYVCTVLWFKKIE